MTNNRSVSPFEEFKHNFSDLIKQQDADGEVFAGAMAECFAHWNATFPLLELLQTWVRFYLLNFLENEVIYDSDESIDRLHAEFSQIKHNLLGLTEKIMHRLSPHDTVLNADEISALSLINLTIEELNETRHHQYGYAVSRLNPEQTTKHDAFKSKLPTIIFCDENHYSVNTWLLLTKLIPQLERLGYRDFHMEQPNSWTLDTEMKNMHQYAQYQLVLEDCKKSLSSITNLISMNLNNNRPLQDLFQDDVMLNTIAIALQTNELSVAKVVLDYFKSKCVLGEALLNGATSAFSQIHLTDFKNNDLLMKLERHLKVEISLDESRALAHKKCLTFLHSIYENHFKFTAIDYDIDQFLVRFGKDAETSNAICRMTQHLRDETMAHAYINANKPVIGYTGLGHYVGLKNNFLKKLPDSQEQICFIYISFDSYLSRKSLTKYPSIQTDPSFKFIDASTYNDMEKTANEVLTFIMDKIALLNASHHGIFSGRGAQNHGAAASYTTGRNNLLDFGP